MNKFILKLLIAGFSLTLFSGCGLVQTMTSSNANAEDTARETLGLKKTGIAECDEVVELLTRKTKGNANAGEESWTDKAVTELVKQQIYNYVNDGGNKTAQEKEDLKGKCRTALSYLKDDTKKEPQKK